MKTGVVIINTARGSVLHEEALVHGLETGKVWSAGLDVFENEPKIHPGLIGNPRVLLLPHMGTYTLQTLQKMEEWAISNVQVAVETGRLKSPVPEQMVSPF
jgi:D-3-phosphoglycerate dehydrogenase